MGGLTPDSTAIVDARHAVRVPVFALIRPWPRGFTCAADVLNRMEAEITALRVAGADGIVTGALTAENDIDLPAMERLFAAAYPLPITFHRAFDEVRDPVGALEALIALGVQRILTAGGRGTALEGVDRLRELVEASRGRIVIMAGGSVRPENVAEVVARSGVREVHARMDQDPAMARRLKRWAFAES